MHLEVKGNLLSKTNPSMGGMKRNRSQVQGSMFSAASGHRSCQFDQKSDAGLAESYTRVKGKEGIEDQKSSSKMLISPSNCQFSSKFWIRPDAEIGQNSSFRSGTKYVTQMHCVDEN